MIDLINSIPASGWLLINAVIVSLMGFYFTQKKTAAEVADLVTQGAGRNMEHYEKRIAQLENDQEQLENKADKFKSLNAKLEQRVTSVEHDLQVYSKELHSLEVKHGALKKKMNQWNDGIQILIKQVERHDSKPDWRPNGE